MWSTTGQGESWISHCRSWMVGPGTPPVRFNSKSPTSLGSGGEMGARGQSPSRPRLALTARPPGCPLHPSPGRLHPQTGEVPITPSQGSTSMMWQWLIFSHVYLMGDLLLFHI